MANKAALGITERESRTLARTFVMARQQGYGWLGATTKDEDFVSIRSKPLDGSKSLELISLSTKPLEQGYLKVPPKYKKVDAPSKPAVASAPQAAPAPKTASDAAEAKNQD